MDLQLGCRTSDVRLLEQKLKASDRYTGPIDGVFGGGVESAVKAFQKAHGFQPNGIVTSEIWGALFPGAIIPPSPLQGRPLAERCLALTGSFETSFGFPECFSELAGNFDGEGISFGVLQWNLGQGTLQPLLSSMLESDPNTMAEVFQDDMGDLKRVLRLPLERQVKWALSIQSSSRDDIFEPWKGFFQALGRTPSFQSIQMNHSERIYRQAVALSKEYDLNTNRGLALLFDVCVQNGCIGSETGARIRADYSAIPESDSPSAEQVARMQAIANRVAESSRAEFVEDVRTRKVVIANGKGRVHNVFYDLADQFSIDLSPFRPPLDAF
jgi:hypothetical protein